jgi:hypothetical protein
VAATLPDAQYPEQKDRIRLVASHVLREARGAIGHRTADRAEAEESEED